MPKANWEDSEQNAFVQDWLNEWSSIHFDPDQLEESGPGDLRDDYDNIQTTLELIQGTYNFQDHEARKNAVATGGDLDAALRLIKKLSEIVPTDSELYKSFELTYAFINATKQIAQREK
jgi:hypothetical protein